MKIIPGVPAGLKVVRWGAVEPGEHTVTVNGTIRACISTETVYGEWLVVAPDNIYDAFDLKAVPIPEGFERDGVDPSDDIPDGQWWFREVDPIDPGTLIWLGADGKPHATSICAAKCGETIWKDEDAFRIILRRKNIKVLIAEITSEEAIAMFERNETVLEAFAISWLIDHKPGEEWRRWM